MARIKATKAVDEKLITPKPILKQTPKEPVKPIVKDAPQPKRKTLQERRPALNGLNTPVERKLVAKPIYGKEDGTKTKAISQTKVIVKRQTPISTPTTRTTAATATTTVTLRPKPQKGEATQGRAIENTKIIEARKQQERAIEEAQAAYTAKQRQMDDSIEALEEKKRIQEVDGNLYLDTRGRYTRKA
jgi:hypothetical protein